MLVHQAPKKKEEKPAAKAPKSGGGGKQKKKKWSKGKQKEKVNNMVLFDQGTYDKLLVEVPKYKLITPSVLSDRLRVSITSFFTTMSLSSLFILALQEFSVECAEFYKLIRVSLPRP